MSISGYTTVNYSFSKKIKGLWLSLIGKPSSFTLECRIFHSISLGITILVSFYIPYYFFEGLYIAASSCFLVGFIFFYQYYRSRFHQKMYNTTLFGLIGIAIFSVNYFYNSGINGSSDLIWPVYLLLVLAISSYREHILWLTVYLVSFSSLHIIEYYFPFLIKHSFNTGRGQFIDRITAFPIPVIGIYIIIKYLRRSYDKERNAAEEKTIAIAARNEQILIQKELLEQSNAEKNKLMSIISHDLRAPLINLQNYLELLGENELDNSQRRVLETGLLKDTKSTINMLSNLLFWTKSQMEGATVNLTEVNLLSALKNTLELEKTLASKKDISLNYQFGPGITVIADLDMLQLVIRNLISNAIKFTPHGGAINITAEMQLNECKVTVSDNGNGIEPSKQGKIFSIKSESTFGTNNEKGVGLGLLLCKEFIEKQGGRIGFESTFGRGSCFFIFVPAKTER